MNKEQQIEVVLRRNQIRNLRGLVNDEIARWEYRPAWLVGLLEVLDDAETAGTIRNARLSAMIDDLKAESVEAKERAEIARVYGPDLVDFVLKQRESNGVHRG